MDRDDQLTPSLTSPLNPSATLPAPQTPAIPPAAVGDLALALDIYRVLTPPDENNPCEAAEYTAAFLAAAGWQITPLDTPPADPDTQR
ncbi:hypothetical protein ACFC1B_07315 [Streptomyces xiamenensis]|uniref:hypothetical protein n=1 Tax=Streptomyces xiamenensis TaxID=408015 RepID=UPI0035D9C238